MASFYSVGVQKKECKVVVRARDSDAKQVLWGWGGDYGSTKDPGAIELYGRGTQRGTGDDEIWEWKLSSDGVRRLKHGIVAQTRDPKRYDVSARENRAAKELLKKVNKQASTLRACKVR